MYRYSKQRWWPCGVICGAADTRKKEKATPLAIPQ